ncbi:hypothetical protein [Desulfosarcina sp.]|uniref:hypothetical protein n=1 Tax=Desulfosarcina sp. TaxID=2027861 RepID=UPI003970A98E
MQVFLIQLQVMQIEICSFGAQLQHHPFDLLMVSAAKPFNLMKHRVINNHIKGGCNAFQTVCQRVDNFIGRMFRMVFHPLYGKVLQVKPASQKRKGAPIDIGLFNANAMPLVAVFDRFQCQAAQQTSLKLADCQGMVFKPGEPRDQVTAEGLTSEQQNDCGRYDDQQ